MHNELKKVSDLITEIIANDDFCDFISPEQLKEAVKLYPLRAGKRLRPALVLWICGLLEGDTRKAEYAAAATEVYHNWTLVHDDIIDGDDFRRGKYATHTKIKKFAENNYKLSEKKCDKFGTDFAILAGDLQQAWALSLLMKSNSLGVPENVVMSLCSDMVNRLSRELISGEALDVEFSYRGIELVDYSEVETMLFLKTSALLNFSAAAGAKIALNETSLSHTQIRRIIDFTSALGIAFQLRDDWLGIYGDVTKLGKPIGSDICSAKPTLLILETLKNLDHKNKNHLLKLLGQKNIREDELDNVRSYVTSSGAEKNILTKINNMKNYADKALDDFPDNKYKKLLLDLNEFLLQRNI